MKLPFGPVAAVGLVALAGLVSVADAYTPGTHAIYAPTEFKWGAGPASLPPGAKFATLEGDMNREGPFTVRATLPANYRIPPHFHTADEHITVLSGTFYLGMGEKFDEKVAKELPAGSFVYLPKEMRHYAYTRGETVIQLHGMGPWGITYVNPADDPRTKEVGLLE